MKCWLQMVAGLLFAAVELAAGPPPGDVPPPGGAPPPTVAPGPHGPWHHHGLPPGSAWLGLRVTKVTPELRSQVPDLPPGVGFVIDTIEENGPAQAAGLQQLDVIWRLDDQLLINEAQLAVLLGMKKPGQAVAITYFRAGQQAKLNLVLGSAPDGAGLSAERWAEQMVIGRGNPGLPVQRVDVLSRTASIENADGRAVLVRDQDGYQLTVTGKDGKTVWEGTLPADGEPKGVPVAWRERAISLRQALEQSTASQGHRPRLRVVPAQPATAGSP